MEYCPIITETPTITVTKTYLDNMLNIMSDLQLKNIYVHADEDISKNVVQLL